jgi:hypothetical protein
MRLFFRLFVMLLLVVESDRGARKIVRKLPIFFRVLYLNKYVLLRDGIFFTSFFEGLGCLLGIMNENISVGGACCG